MVKLIIKHDNSSEYLTQAESARDEVLGKHPKATIELVVGSSNQFDIVIENCDEEYNVFSKENSGNFPGSGEVLSSLEIAWILMQKSLGNE
tara:strand:- start:56 stop:328 length:273 start_codon:yes stop_codon:yes gene_type:complete